MLDTIQVHVEHFSDDEEYGPVFVASNDELMFTTDGKTFEELIQNVREAIALCMEDDELIAKLELVANPRIILSMAVDYAETT